MAAAHAALPRDAPHHEADQEEERGNRHDSKRVESRLDVLPVVGYLGRKELCVGSHHGDVFEVLQVQEADSAVYRCPSCCAESARQPRGVKTHRIDGHLFV